MISIVYFDNIIIYYEKIIQFLQYAKNIEAVL